MMSCYAASKTPILLYAVQKLVVIVLYRQQRKISLCLALPVLLNLPQLPDEIAGLQRDEMIGLQWDILSRLKLQQHWAGFGHCLRGTLEI